MKHLFTIAITALALAAYSSSAFAGDCGSCPAGGDKAKDKAKDKTEEAKES